MLAPESKQTNNSSTPWLPFNPLLMSGKQLLLPGNIPLSFKSTGPSKVEFEKWGSLDVRGGIWRPWVRRLLLRNEEHSKVTSRGKLAPNRQVHPVAAQKDLNSFSSNCGTERPQIFLISSPPVNVGLVVQAGTELASLGQNVQIVEMSLPHPPPTFLFPTKLAPVSYIWLMPCP